MNSETGLESREPAISIQSQTPINGMNYACLVPVHLFSNYGKVCRKESAIARVHLDSKLQGVVRDTSLRFEYALLVGSRAAVLLRIRDLRSGLGFIAEVLT